MQDLPHLKVVGPVVLDEHVGLIRFHVVVEFVIRLVDGGIGRAGVISHHLIRKLLVIAGEPDQVVMPGDHPKFVEFVPVDGVFISDSAVLPVWVLDNFRSEHIIVDSRYHNTTTYFRIMVALVS